MYKHCFILDKLVEKYLPWIHQHLTDHGIIVEMFLSDWIISFLCSYIPFDRLTDYFENFFVLGWYAFHWMALAIIKFLEEEILKGIDMP